MQITQRCYGSLPDCINRMAYPSPPPYALLTYSVRSSPTLRLDVRFVEVVLSWLDASARGRSIQQTETIKDHLTNTLSNHGSCWLTNTKWMDF